MKNLIHTKLFPGRDSNRPVPNEKSHGLSLEPTRSKGFLFLFSHFGNLYIMVRCGAACNRAGQYNVCLWAARREGRFLAAVDCVVPPPLPDNLYGASTLLSSMHRGRDVQPMQITCLRHSKDFT